MVVGESVDHELGRGPAGGGVVGDGQGSGRGDLGWEVLHGDAGMFLDVGKTVWMRLRKISRTKAKQADDIGFMTSNFQFEKLIVNFSFFNERLPTGYQLMHCTAKFEVIIYKI